MYICYLVYLKAWLYNFVTRPCCFTFLVLIAQLLNRNSKIHKNIGRKIEFRKTNFREGANFNNFRRVQFRNLEPKSLKQIPRIFFHLESLPAKYSTNNRSSHHRENICWSSRRLQDMS